MLNCNYDLFYRREPKEKSDPCGRLFLLISRPTSTSDRFSLLKLGRGSHFSLVPDMSAHRLKYELHPVPGANVRHPCMGCFSLAAGLARPATQILPAKYEVVQFAV
jgi:hypothetical protein